ncbi:MAG: hypothetical protein HY982_02035 [Candidatus Magasanikbacteria bacterium]|nr:hypothetical protein [Candidatus Magasanikbacteria bacterium]
MARFFSIIFITGLLLLNVSAVKGTEGAKNLQGAESRLSKIGSAYGPSASKTMEQRVGDIIRIALILVGVIFLLLTVYGGYIWMLAREDESEAKKAKDIITRAVIGLVIVLAAYAITYFVTAYVFTS